MTNIESSKAAGVNKLSGRVLNDGANTETTFEVKVEKAQATTFEFIIGSSQGDSISD